MKPVRPRPLTDAKDDAKLKPPKRKAPRGKTREMKPAISDGGYKTR